MSNDVKMSLEDIDDICEKAARNADGMDDLQKVLFILGIQKLIMPDEFGASEIQQHDLLKGQYLLLQKEEIK